MNMPHLELTEEIRAAAALYSLGAMPEEEARRFERHLAEGCAVCRVKWTRSQRLPEACLSRWKRRRRRRACVPG